MNECNFELINSVDVIMAFDEKLWISFVLSSSIRRYISGCSNGLQYYPWEMCSAL